MSTELLIPPTIERPVTTLTHERRPSSESLTKRRKTKPSNAEHALLVRHVRTFARDGFIDRYTGQQLLYPGALLALQQLQPRFLRQMQQTISSQSPSTRKDELMPCIDRVVPLHLGGTDDEQNWITTSVRRHIMRGIHTTQQLGWEIRPAGELKTWDGLMQWFLQQMENKPALRQNNPELQKWHKIADTGKWQY